MRSGPTAPPLPAPGLVPGCTVRPGGSWGGAAGSSREEGHQRAWQSWDGPGPQGSLREHTTATGKAGPVRLQLLRPYSTPHHLSSTGLPAARFLSLCSCSSLSSPCFISPCCSFPNVQGRIQPTYDHRFLSFFLIYAFELFLHL